MDPNEKGTWRYSPECECWLCDFARKVHKGSEHKAHEMPGFSDHWSRESLAMTTNGKGHIYSGYTIKAVSVMRPDRWAGRDPKKTPKWFNPDCTCYWCGQIRLEYYKSSDLSHWTVAGRTNNHVDYIEGALEPNKEIEEMKNNKQLYIITAFRNAAVANEAEAMVLSGPTLVFARDANHARLIGLASVKGFNVDTDTVRVTQTTPNDGSF